MNEFNHAHDDKLPEEERVSLSSRLLHGLQSPADWVSDEEALRRMIEADEDTCVMITFDELASGFHRLHKAALDEAKQAVDSGAAAFGDWEDAKNRIHLKTAGKA